MLPNFLIIGAQKAGSTSLYRYLRSHPDVFMPGYKEPDYFVAERNWGEGQPWYEDLFEPGAGAAAWGEASTTYTMYPHYDGVPERIAEVLGDVRLVYVLRDPVERARSDYLHYRFPPAAKSRKFFARETLPIERALLENPIYLDTSRYAMQLERYLAVFPRERILVVTTEELAMHRADVVARVLRFIGVDPERAPMPLDEEYNRTEAIRVPRPLFEMAEGLPGIGTVIGRAPTRLKRAVGFRKVPVAAGAMSPELRRAVAELLRDDTARLRTHLGPEFHCWGLA